MSHDDLQHANTNTGDSRSYNYPDRAVYDGDITVNAVSFVDSVRKHKWIVVGAAVLGGLAAFALTLPQTKLYRAHASLEFAGLNDNVLNTRDLDPAATGDNSSQAYINTQARVLQSLPFLSQVVARTKKEPRPGTVDNPQRRAEALRRLRAETLATAVEIRPTDGTRLIDIYVQSPDPDLATELANNIVDEFTTESVEAKFDASKRTSGWLGKQLEEVKDRLEKSEAALQAYARRSNIVFQGTDEDSVAEARLRQIQDEYSRAQADRIAKQSVYEGLLAEKPEDAGAALRDPVLQDYQLKLSDLTRQMAELSTVYKPSYEKVQRLQSQIEQLKKDYKQQHETAVARVLNDFQTAQRREAMLNRAYLSQQSVVTDEAGKTVDYNILKREAETNRTIYEGMLQKVKSYGIASAMQPSNVRVVDPAQKPLFPYKPNVPLTTMFGVIGSLSLALVWVGVRKAGEVTVEYPGQTRRALNIPELGVIPAATLVPYLTGGRANRRRLTQPVVEISGASLSKDSLSIPQNTVATASWFHRSSLLAESVRSIRTSILYGQTKNPPRTIVVTSLSPAHGKTSFVSNMGIAMAEVGKRTLIIDADLRRPSLHTAFGLNNDVGLTDALTAPQRSEDGDLSALIQGTAVPGLALLSSGAFPPGTSSSNLFHSASMGAFLNDIRPDYDVILIDTPPLTLSDARILGPLSDGVVLVLRAGEVRMDSVYAAEERLAEDGSRVLGTVLNNWNPKSNGYGSYPNRYYERSYFQSAKN